jgi:hypothetical protein
MEDLDDLFDNAENAHALLKAVYQCQDVPLPVRMRAAMACLPFETPKLLATAIINEKDFATLLDQRIERMKQMKLIEAKPTPTTNENGGGVDARLPPPIPDRRFRRI